MSNGLVPMLRVYNATARYVDQGGNKRPGAFAIYLEPWHSDIFDFLDLKKNTGKEEQVLLIGRDHFAFTTSYCLNYIHKERHFKSLLKIWMYNESTCGDGDLKMVLLRLSSFGHIETSDIISN